MDHSEGPLDSHQPDVKVSDARPELVCDVLVLSDAPPVENVREQARHQPSQSPQPGWLVGARLTSPAVEMLTTDISTGTQTEAEADKESN